MTLATTFSKSINYLILIYSQLYNWTRTCLTQRCSFISKLSASSMEFLWFFVSDFMDFDRNLKSMTDHPIFAKKSIFFICIAWFITIYFELIYLVPSFTTWVANSPGYSSLMAVWIYLLVIVGVCCNGPNEILQHRYVQQCQLVMMLMGLLEILVSRCTCFNTL